MVINEIQAAPNELLLERSPEGVTHAGWGPVWQSLAFTAPDWRTGRAPVGHGYPSGQLGTDVSAEMKGRTPVLYVRRAFTLTEAQAARTEDLLVKVRYDDGFVLWINGREVTRANLGPAGQHVYHRQVTFRAGIPQASPPTPAVMEWSPGPVRDWLRPGENLVALTVSNRHPGSETTAANNSACLIDLALSVVPERVETALAGADFAESNGSTRTFRRLTAGLEETVSGTPPPGSWLATAAPPVIPATHSGLTIKALAANGEGAAAPGAMRWEVSQTAAGTQSAEFYGGPLALTGRLPGTVTAADLDRLTFRFHWATPSSGGGVEPVFGFRLEAAGGVSLTGFPTVSAAGLTDPAPNEFANVYGGSRRLTVDAGGGTAVNSSGVLRGNLLLSCGPAMRGGIFRVTEDITAGAGYNGTAGVLKCGMTQAPVVADEVRFSYPGMAVPAFAAGKISAEDFIRQGWTVALKAPAGRAVRLFLTPDHAAAAASGELDFGTVTGTGIWQVTRFSFAEGAGAPAVRAAMNQFSITGFRLGAAFSANLPLGQAVWLDRAGTVTPWRNYTASFSSAGAAEKNEFAAALNASAVKTMTPVFATRSHPVTPGWHGLVLDDAALVYLESGGTTEFMISEGAEGWQFFPGHCEPTGGLADPASFGRPGYDGDWSDWIELHNAGTQPQSLAGWHLSDDLNQRTKWRFPDGALIPSGGYLVVLAAGDKAAPPGSRYLHADFKLGGDGGSVVLSDASGNLMSVAAGFPRQDGFHTWALGAAGQYGYGAAGTPGTANSGGVIPARCDKPGFDAAPGYHDPPVTLTMASPTAGAEIRYTMDGSEPGATSALYTAPLTLAYAGNGRGHCVRARAFKDGFLSSEIRTATYLVGQHQLLRAAPAICLTGDEGRTFFKPCGIAAIQGGSRPGGLWQADTITDYNNALGDLNNPLETGQPWERPVTMEFLPGAGGSAFAENLGIRISGSPFSRPRYELDDIATLPWSFTNLLEKPSFNLWWRGEYGEEQLSYPVFGEDYPVRSFRHLRLPGGHNDMPNPYVKDELVRRIFIDMGRQGSQGSFHPVFVNGRFAGIYNLCERVREPFMQAHFGGAGQWDVIQRGEIANGDNVAFQQMLARIDAHAAQTTAANYAAVEEILDIEALIDYLLLYCWAGTGDWPHNNWIASRERAPGGKWRWFPWDAEGAFGGFSKTLGYNIFTQDLLTDINGANRELCRVYSSLRRNAEFRLKFADAVNRHLCNGGALTDARLTAGKTRVAAEYQPLLGYILSAAVNEGFFNEWVNSSAIDKRDVLFRSAVLTVSGMATEQGYQLPGQNLWPALEGRGSWQAPLPPHFSQHGGTVPAGFALTIGHTVSAADRTADNPFRPAGSQTPPNRVIYYTTDGQDPRAEGGALSSSAAGFTGALTLPARQTVVKARIRNTLNQEWSPLTEAAFLPQAELPSAGNLVVAELMYHPPGATALEPGYGDQDDFEFIRLMNAGSAPVDLRPARFSAGIGFNFASGSIGLLDPGESVLLVADRQAFTLRYGPQAAARIAGEFSGQLSNSGEWLRLENEGGQIILEFGYDDAPPWPEKADGGGASLLLLQPMSRPDHASAFNWTASAVPGGLGGAGNVLTYERWKSYLWPVGGAGAAPGDDPDQDGQSNLMEFLFGQDPFRAGGAGLRTGLVENSGERFLTIEADTLPVSGLTFTVECGDGRLWDANHTAVPLGAPELLPDGRWRRRWRDTVPVSRGPRRFMRIRAGSPWILSGE